MRVVVSNDYVMGINGEEVLWTFLCKHIDNFIGVDCRVVGTVHTNINFHIMFKEYINKNISDCKIIIQNATFMGFVDNSKFTIVYLQDNLRAMNRINSQQEHNLRFANMIVTNSKLTAESYSEYKCEIIPIGVNDQMFKPLNKQQLREEFNLISYDKIGIFVGALNEVKGWSEINRIISNRPDIFFIVVSKYNDGRCILPNSITYNKIDQILLSKLLNCADFFILGSPVETQCLGAIEACFCDIPVIMKNTGIFMDFSTEDKNKVGFFGDDLASGIDKIYSSEFSPRDTMIKQGLSIEGMLVKWRQLISKCDV